jgi:UDP-N-acetylmuramate dehydrogenase
MRSSSHFNLKRYNTFNIEVYCEQFIEVEKEAELNLLWENDVFNHPFFILGGGSNVLFTKNFNGTVIHVNTRGITEISDTENTVFIEVAAGEIWDNLVDFCINRNYFGIENLAGIPGRVGSCPVQNIGAYGVEVKNIIKEIKGRSIKTGEIKILTNDECHFGYRNSIFQNELKNQFLITSVIFKLSKEEQYHLSYATLDALKYQSLNLTTVKNAILEIRNQKLPNLQEVGSSGSFFKNPMISLAEFRHLQQQFPELVYFPVDENTIKLAAGQLIEQCGWKGYRELDAGVYPHQALVLVNYGKATGEELLALSQKITQSIHNCFGINIEPEVNIL